MIKSENRIEYLDIAKGIAIILMVYGHTYRGSFLNEFIFSFHMPLFFFISGLLFSGAKYHTFGSFLKRKFKTILIPYISFYILSYFYWLFIERYLRPGYLLPFNVPIIGFFYGVDYKEYMCPNGALWFLACLFSSEIILYGIFKLTAKTAKRINIIVSFIIMGFLLSFYDVFPLPFGLSTSFVALLFLCSGFYLKQFAAKIEAMNKGLSLFLAFVLFVVLFFSAQKNGIIAMAYRDYQNIVLFIVNACIGITASLLFSHATSSLKWLQFIGINSIVILGISEPLKRALIGLSSKLLEVPVNDLRISAIYGVLCVLLVLLFILPFIFIINKYLYFMLGKSKPNYLKENRHGGYNS